jgi:hypothetical protein
VREDPRLGLVGENHTPTFQTRPDTVPVDHGSFTSMAANLAANMMRRHRCAELKVRWETVEAYRIDLSVPFANQVAGTFGITVTADSLDVNVRTQDVNMVIVLGTAQVDDQDVLRVRLHWKSLLSSLVSSIGRRSHRSPSPRFSLIIVPTIFAGAEIPGVPAIRTRCIETGRVDST